MTPSTKRHECKLGCGREIIWGVTAEGAKVPLDPRAPVYYVSTPEVAAIARIASGSVVARLAHKIEQPGGAGSYGDAMVSHFSTCSQVGKLKAKGITTNEAAVKEMIEPGA